MRAAPETDLNLSPTQQTYTVNDSDAMDFVDSSPLL